MLRFIRSVVKVVLVAGVLASPAVVAAQGKTKIHWYGQSAWKITTPSGGVILIDPWLKVPTNPDKNSIAELDRVDYILITHGHFDHVGDALEILKKTGAKVAVVDPVVAPRPAVVLNAGEVVWDRRVKVSSCIWTVPPSSVKCF